MNLCFRELHYMIFSFVEFILHPGPPGEAEIYHLSEASMGGGLYRRLLYLV